MASYHVEVVALLDLILFPLVDQVGRTKAYRVIRSYHL